MTGLLEATWDKDINKKIVTKLCIQQNFIKDYVNAVACFYIFKQAKKPNWTSATTFQSIYMAVAINLLDFHGLTNEACS